VQASVSPSEMPASVARQHEEPSPELDERAWNALVAEYLPALTASAQRLCRSNFDSDDLVQITLLRALRAHHQLRDQTRMLPWLLAILHRVFCDENRRRRRSPSVALEDRHDITVEHAEPLPWESITDADLRSAIEALPDDVRDTYRMFALEHRPYAEISKQLGIPARTVGTRIFRARKQLRELLAIKLGAR
jgi:RNA polymerase sigma factor (sigma-70 family)